MLRVSSLSLSVYMYLSHTRISSLDSTTLSYILHKLHSHPDDARSELSSGSLGMLRVQIVDGFIEVSVPRTATVGEVKELLVGYLNSHIKRNSVRLRR